MITIYLKDLLFYNAHGLFPGEDIVESGFIVNVELLFEHQDQPIVDIDKTIDYTKLYDIVKQRMDIPTPLIETIAMNIGNEIIEKFPFIKFIKIDIQKQHPPISGMIGSVGVNWFKNIN